MEVFTKKVVPFDHLTLREREILKCIATGKSNREIADKLFISLNTVKTHIKNIYSKLYIKRRTQALLFAIELSTPP